MPDDIERSTIREWITLNLQPVYADMADIKSLLDKLSISIVTVQQLDQLKYQVASLSEAMHEMERRLRQVERYTYVMFFLLTALIIVLVTSLVVSGAQAAMD